VDLKQCLLLNRQLQREKELQHVQLIAVQADHEACYARGLALKERVAALERHLGEAGLQAASAKARVEQLQAEVQENRAGFLQSRIDLEKTREAHADALRQGEYFQELLQQRENELQAVKHSTIWKMTGPLRYAKHTLARYGRGGK